jgi:hypothetical protein
LEGDPGIDLLTENIGLAPGEDLAFGLAGRRDKKAIAFA